MENPNKTNLTPKERIELFQETINKLAQENEAKSVRQLLHERYLQSKKDEEQKKNVLDSKKTTKEKNNDNKKSGQIKSGKQLARVFRFDQNNHFRIRRQNRPNNHDREYEVDPLLNDPNVLFENFAFDDANHENQEDVPFIAEDAAVNYEEEDDDDINDDSFKSLIISWLRKMTWFQIIMLILKIIIYIIGQKLANSYGFGAAYLILSLLIFIWINLGEKTPGEWSAYSVFNPNCQPIPTVASSDQPREQILLGFGPL